MVIIFHLTNAEMTINMSVMGMFHVPDNTTESNQELSYM